jgi:hypothetical protein
MARLGNGRMLLTKKSYPDWRAIQDDYLAFLGPWSEAEVIDFLELDYPDLTLAADLVHSFVVSDEEVLVP